MKSCLKLLLVSVAVIFAAGCTEIRLHNGFYRVDDGNREDCICVYKNYMFIYVKSPDNVPVNTAYWIWAGKYSVDESGIITLDMSDEDKGTWNFSYGFMYRHGAIIVNDYATNIGKTFRYIPPKSLVKKPEALPSTMPIVEPGADSEVNYTPMY